MESDLLIDQETVSSLGSSHMNDFLATPFVIEPRRFTYGGINQHDLHNPQNSKLIRTLGSFLELPTKLSKELNASDGQASDDPESNEQETACKHDVPDLPEEVKVLIVNGTHPSDEIAREITHQFIAARLSDYIMDLIRIPEIMKSNVMEDFLAPPPSTEEKNDQALSDDNNEKSEMAYITNWLTRQLHQYLPINTAKAPGRDQEIRKCRKHFYDIFFAGGINQNILVSIPPREQIFLCQDISVSSWIVFRIVLEKNSSPVKVTLFVDKPIENDFGQSVIPDLLHDTHVAALINQKEDQRSASATTMNLHEKNYKSEHARELLTQQIDLESPIMEGSYRCEGDDEGQGENMQYVLEITNEASLLWAAHVDISITCVPDEAFQAACRAVGEQWESDKKRQRAPLLCQIFDSVDTDPISLEVKPFYK